MPQPQQSLNLKHMIAGLGNLYDGFTCGTYPTGIDEEHIWFVNANMDKTGDGQSWDSAYLTIQEAITANNATIDWGVGVERYGVIFVAPGVYAENLNVPFYCYVIGTGVRGSDTMSEIHPATGSCITGTMLGTILINLWLEVDEAVDCINAGICNNTEVVNCTFTNGAAVAATAISTDNCAHLNFHHNYVLSGQTTGMKHGVYFHAGYAHSVSIHHNHIQTTDTGVYVAIGCTSSCAMIGPENMIWCSGGASKGVDENKGHAIVYGNWIRAIDAIEHAGGAGYTIGNSVVNNITGAKETTGS